MNAGESQEWRRPWARSRSSRWWRSWRIAVSRRESSRSPIGYGRATTAAVRATPESTLLEEIYEYTQTVSHNPSGPDVVGRRGRVEIVTPYDGDRYFGLQAVADTEPLLHRRDSNEPLIGHLLLDRHRNVEFSADAGIDNRFGSIPLHVIVRDPESGKPVACDDRHACRTVIDYKPSRETPQFTPIFTLVDLHDPDNIDLPSVDLAAEGTAGFEDVSKRISNYVAFESNLTLTLGVQLTLPIQRSGPPPRPRVRRLALRWPTVTSLEPSALRLRVGAVDWPLQHDPAGPSLEWRDVEFKEPESDNARRLQVYQSLPMQLEIAKPGEMFTETELNCTVEVDVPNFLLSGIDAQLYDATGRPARRKPKRRTRIINSVATEIDQAFDGRLRSPFQHLHFDEIIPDELRIADIKTALKDLGFSIERDIKLASARRQLRHLLIAQRREGPDKLTLWLVIGGVKHKTERQSRRPGYRYTSKLGSGELRLFVRGEFRGDSGEAVRQMNMLHLILRERFERIRDQR